MRGHTEGSAWMALPHTARMSACATLTAAIR